jgi:hypothetical protein
LVIYYALMAGSLAQLVPFTPDGRIGETTQDFCNTTRLMADELYGTCCAMGLLSALPARKKFTFADFCPERGNQDFAPLPLA